ncbi:MAG: hypothetical protein Q9171_005486 [Xanthocarpia ochracea]
MDPEPTPDTPPQIRTEAAIRASRAFWANILSGTEPPSPTEAPPSPSPPPSPRPRSRTLTPPNFTPPAVPTLESRPERGTATDEVPKRKKLGIVTPRAYPEPPELRPAPPYHLWHPTTVIFEYMHIRGFLAYEKLPDRLLSLCRWFNNARPEDTESQKVVWKSHVNRVQWLKWYWDEQEKNRAKNYDEREERMLCSVQYSSGGVSRVSMRSEDVRTAKEKVKKCIAREEEEEDDDEESAEEKEERELDIIMDLDLEEGEVSEGQNRQRGQCVIDKDDVEEKEWKPNLVNRQGQADPKGLTQEDWEVVRDLEDAWMVEEGATTKEMVTETVAWANDVIETGEMAKSTRAAESEGDEPTHKRVGEVMNTRWTG